MTTWRRGREIVAANRRRAEGSLGEFVENVRREVCTRCPVPRSSRTRARTPPRWRCGPTREHNHVLHEGVLIVSASPSNVPHVPTEDRFTVDDLGLRRRRHPAPVRAASASPTRPTCPTRCSRRIASGACSGRTCDRRDASYFLSRGPIRRTHEPGMARWRKALFLALAHNAADPADYFGLPRDRTVTMGSEVDV